MNFTCAVWYGNDDYSPTNRMTGGSLPAQTWREIMVVAHQGVEVKEVPGIGMGQKVPQTAQAAAAAAGAPKIIDTKPGPPPVLTKRGADILVRIEKQLDDAGKAAARTSATEPPKPARQQSSTSVTFPESFAAATPGDQPAPAGRKN